MMGTRGRFWGLVVVIASSMVLNPGDGNATAAGHDEPARAFAVSSIVTDREKSGRQYQEFLRVPSLSMGLYVLAAGAVDKQTPHGQDEVYQVLAGRAVLTVEGKDYPVVGGSIVYVRAHAQHRFHDITEDLTTLVFFAPAEKE
jgi:mannose-6-phosphate isomerase-like protein (cupin superfamily)